MIIFNLPCRPGSLQYRSRPNGGDTTTSSSVPCGILPAESAGVGEVVLVLVHIFINKYLHYRTEKQWERKKKQQPCDETMAAPRGVLLFVVTQRTSYAN